MNIIIYNMVWMTWNTLLALFSVMLGWLVFKKKKAQIRWFLVIIWFLFIPNTIYTLTDLSHLSEQWIMLYGIEKYIVVLQYLFLIVLGIVTFVISLYFFECMLTHLLRKKISESVTHAIIGSMNFIIGFGVIMGRVQRTNSWDIFINPLRVYYDSIHILSSPLLLIAVFAFGLICNIIYFSAREIYQKTLYSFKKFLVYPP